jgi:stalled ribosome rescue protein Dom34
MSFKHAVVWLDHREAHIIHFNAEEKTTQIVKSSTGSDHLHHHSGTLGSGKSAVNHAYLHDVVKHLVDATEVLVVGPGSAKLDLLKHIHKHDAAVADKIVGVETVDHPTDGQLLAYAKKTFVKIDNLRGDDFKV